MFSEVVLFSKIIRSLTVGDLPGFFVELERRLCVLVVEISRAHFQSAAQAIEAFGRSSRSSEASAAISHLRDAFNIGKLAVHRERQSSYFFGLFTSTTPQFSDFEKIDLLMYLSIVARLISRVYEFVEEKENALQWLEQNKNILVELKELLSSASEYKSQSANLTSVEATVLKLALSTGGQDAVEIRSEIRPGGYGKGPNSHLENRAALTRKGINAILDLMNQ